MKPGGVPDESRAARVILKDFVVGKLLFRRAPPNMDQEEYDPSPEKDENVFEGTDDISLEESFPELRVSSGVHFRGRGAPERRTRRRRGMRIEGNGRNLEDYILNLLTNDCPCIQYT